VIPPFSKLLHTGSILALTFLAATTPAEAAHMTLPPFSPLVSFGDAKEPVQSSAPKEAKPPEVMFSRTGPWGQLEYFETFIQAPEDIILANQPHSTRTRWFFGGMDAQGVKDLLGELQLPQGLETALCAEDSWLLEPDGINLYPSPAQLLELPVSSRAKLYSTLSRWEQNFYHLEPELIYTGSVRSWFQGFEVSEAVLSFTEKVSYKLGSTLLFADTPAVLGFAETEKERLEILRAFSRTPTLMAKVIIAPAAKKEAAEYWSKPFSAQDTSPFLEAVLRQENSAQADLLHLLPANVRKILYTYHNPKTSFSGYMPDCHWTALNFFNAEPFERLCEPAKATSYTLANFIPVAPPYELGDVLFFTDTQTGDAYHSCAYIADDVVFTKNGRSPLQPWVLMKLDSVKALYDMHFHTNVTAYRRKPST
jgi:hypothetical protein